MDAIRLSRRTSQPWDTTIPFMWAIEKNETPLHKVGNLLSKVLRLLKKKSESSEHRYILEVSLKCSRWKRSEDKQSEKCSKVQAQRHKIKHTLQVIASVSFPDAYVLGLRVLMSLVTQRSTLISEMEAHTNNHTAPRGFISVTCGCSRGCLTRGGEKS